MDAVNDLKFTSVLEEAEDGALEPSGSIHCSTCSHTSPFFGKHEHHDQRVRPRLDVRRFRR